MSLPTEEQIEITTRHVSVLLALGASTRIEIARRRREHPTDIRRFAGAFREGQLDIYERFLVDGYARWTTTGEGDRAFVDALRTYRDLCG